VDLSVRSAALEAPDGLAVVDGERELTWRDLAGQVARVREGLRPWLEAVCGRMAVVGGTGFESVTAILALLEEGRTCVLLHPRWSAAERERAVLQSGASVVIETDGALRKSPASPPAVGSADRIDRGRVIVFTSGTSGAPRGAVLRHSALLASARAHGAVFGWRKTDRWLLGLPTAHVGGLMIVVRSLAARRAVVLPDRTGRRTGFDPAELLRTVERTRVSLLSVVPTMLTRLLALKAGPPPSVRAVLVGGAPAAPALMARARRQGWPVYAT